jgi:hypothetical protein
MQYRTRPRRRKPELVFRNHRGSGSVWRTLLPHREASVWHCLVARKVSATLWLDVVAHLALAGLLYDRVCKLSLDSYICVLSKSTGVGAENRA